MMRRGDPRIRQTLNRLSHNLESANESAQEGIYTFSQHYISPCFAAIGNCVHACTAPCLPSREDQLRRRRRGQNAEAIFDFYDDWDNSETEGDGLLGWGTDELDRLLAGSGLARGRGGGTFEQPRRQRKMSYGTRNPRRKSAVVIPDERSDTTVIPSSSILGFLERFPWRIGSRGLKYRPSAADLQINPQGPRRHVPEDEPLMEETEDADDGGEPRGRSSLGENVRDRSGTQSSRETNTSLSSRGDLILSEEEEDAVPLDDEFAMTLGRRGTGFDSDDVVAGRPESMRRSTSGNLSLATGSSRGSRRKTARSNTSRSMRMPDADRLPGVETRSMVDLKVEEELVAHEEEAEVARKRAAAQKLAASRGLQQENNPQTTQSPAVPPEDDTAQPDDPSLSTGMVRKSSQFSDWHVHRSSSQTEPFPLLPTGPPSSSEDQEFGSMASGLESNADDEAGEGPLTMSSHAPAAVSDDAGK